jgi:predicted dehydrogenase
VVQEALKRGIDVVVDKPIAIRMEEQDAIEGLLAAHPDRRLLNLLTLRGQPSWRGLKDTVAAGEVGVPAFCHVRMAVQLKREQRPPWFLDCRRSGGVFLDLLIHGIDMVEWCMGRKIIAVTATTGNMGYPADAWLRDHATVFCELEGGASAVVEGQRMLPGTKGSDYRMTLVGTEGYADLVMGGAVTVTNPRSAEKALTELPEATSVVADWLDGGDLIPQAASLRANRLAIYATLSAERHERLIVQ